MAELGCNDECSYDKRCLTRACWQEAFKLRRDFWGKPDEDPLMPKQRLEQIVNIYQICHAVKVIFIYYIMGYWCILSSISLLIFTN